MSTKDYKTPNEIVIKVKAGNRAEVDQKKKRKNSPEKSKGRRRFLHRRSGGLINFYDLGQIKNEVGQWIDIPIPFAFENRFTPLDFFEYRNLPQNDADWTAWRDYYASIPLTQWKTHFRKLGFEDAEQYGLDVQDTAESIYYPVARNGSRLNAVGDPVVDTKWTDKGLNLPEPLPAFELTSIGAFSILNNDPGLTKVTNEFNFAADAVPSPALKNGDSVFLTPEMQQFLFYRPIEASPFDLTAALYEKYVRPLQRSKWLVNDPDWNAWVLSYSTATKPSLAFIQTVISDLMTGGNGHYVRNDTFPTRSLGDPAAFLDGVSELHYINVPAEALFGDNMYFDQTLWKNGTFLGLILRGSTPYYFWNLTDRNPLRIDSGRFWDYTL